MWNFHLYIALLRIECADLHSQHHTDMFGVLAELMMDDPTDATRSYEEGIFARLKKVKAEYDPNNLFRDLYYVHPNAQGPTDRFHEGN